MMHIQKLAIDTEAIAQGVYQMIVDRDETAIVAFGMLPSWAKDALTKGIADKILEENARHMDCTAADLAAHVDKKMMAAIVEPIVRQVYLDVLGMAKKKGQLLV